MIWPPASYQEYNQGIWRLLEKSAPVKRWIFAGSRMAVPQAGARCSDRPAGRRRDFGLYFTIDEIVNTGQIDKTGKKNSPITCAIYLNHCISGAKRQSQTDQRLNDLTRCRWKKSSRRTRKRAGAALDLPVCRKPLRWNSRAAMMPRPKSWYESSMANVKVLIQARGSLTTFAERGIGDVSVVLEMKRCWRLKA